MDPVVDSTILCLLHLMTRQYHVLNSGDRHEKTWRPTFLHLHNTPHNTPYLEKPDRNTLVTL